MGSWIRSCLRRDRIQLPVGMEIISNFSKFSCRQGRSWPHSRCDGYRNYFLGNSTMMLTPHDQLEWKESDRTSAGRADWLRDRFQRHWVWLWNFRKKFHNTGEEGSTLLVPLITSPQSISSRSRETVGAALSIPTGQQALTSSQILHPRLTFCVYGNNYVLYSWWSCYLKPINQIFGPRRFMNDLPQSGSIAYAIGRSQHVNYYVWSFFLWGPPSAFSLQEPVWGVFLGAQKTDNMASFLLQHNSYRFARV